MTQNNIPDTSPNLNSLRALLDNPENLTYDKIAYFFNHSPQLKFAGIQVNLIKKNEAQLVIPEVKDFHQGGIGTHAVNGGIIALLCDLTLGLLGADYMRDGFNASQNLSVDFLKPLVATKVFAYGKVQQVIGRKLICNIEVSNEKSEICAVGHGILVTAIKH